jgi:outer membrane biosynthesis protein TonB
MSRELNTPLILWICAAVCAHFMVGEGGEQVAEFHDDGIAIASLGKRVRARILYSEQTFEVSSIGAEQESPVAPEAEVPKPPPPPPPAPPKPTATVAPEPPKPPPPEKKVAVVVKPDDPAKKLLPPPQIDHRIAVKQHVQANQEDNPQAHFLGDEANHVDKETVATQTSHDQDDPNPTPGGSHAGPQENVGDSDRTKIAESEEHAGDKRRFRAQRGHNRPCQAAMGESLARRASRIPAVRPRLPT